MNLAEAPVRVSRIRRDPPPVVKKVSAHEQKVRDAWVIVVGVVAFALAIAIILFAAGSVAGWSPRQYTIQIQS